MRSYKKRLNQFLIIPFLMCSTIGVVSCVSTLKNTAEYGAPALKAAVGAAKAARPISPSEEYYLGRTVAAKFISMYPVLSNKKLTNYVSNVGHSLAMNSEKPETFGGYHFAILNTPEPNAFACPGGTILISKGLIELTQNEDELAAVLAHEIAHVQHKDGVSAIKSSRWTKALTLIGSLAAEKYGPKELGRLVNLFEGSVEDVMETLVVKGYGRKQELKADKTALTILEKTGYAPNALFSMIKRLNGSGQETEKKGLMATHPASAERLTAIEKKIASMKKPPETYALVRTKRFKASTSSI